jgi:hypothetical protein
MTPTGSCDGAMIVLATISESTKNDPPKKADAGNKNV